MLLAGMCYELDDSWNEPEGAERGAPLLVYVEQGEGAHNGIEDVMPMTYRIKVAGCTRQLHPGQVLRRGERYYKVMDVDACRNATLRNMLSFESI